MKSVSYKVYAIHDENVANTQVYDLVYQRVYDRIREQLALTISTQVRNEI